jgi:hypothetical protein
MHLGRLSVLASAALVISVATSLRADTFFVNATQSGWFSDTGQHISGNSNYEIGDTETTAVLRNFATFTLPTLNAQFNFVSATVTITNGTTSTSDPSETATFFDVSTSPATLSSGFSSGSSTGQAVYNDLGTGATYGSQVYFPSDSSTGTKTITLNSAALDAMNAARGSTFSIGGAVTSLDATDNIELIYIGPSTPAFQLALTTGPAPEPSSAAVLGVITAIFTARRKRLSR